MAKFTLFVVTMIVCIISDGFASPMRDGQTPGGMASMKTPMGASGPNSPQMNQFDPSSMFHIGTPMGKDMGGLATAPRDLATGFQNAVPAMAGQMGNFAAQLPEMNVGGALPGLQPNQLNPYSMLSGVTAPMSQLTNAIPGSQMFSPFASAAGSALTNGVSGLGGALSGLMPGAAPSGGSRPFYHPATDAAAGLFHTGGGMLHNMGNMFGGL